MRVYCKDKNEFIKLQRYLIDNCGYIWNNGDTELQSSNNGKTYEIPFFA